MKFRGRLFVSNIKNLYYLKLNRIYYTWSRLKDPIFSTDDNQFLSSSIFS